MPPSTTGTQLATAEKHTPGRGGREGKGGEGRGEEKKGGEGKNAG